jgi:transketolase
MKTYLTKTFFTDTRLDATRSGFGDALLRLGSTHPNVVALCSDLTESTKMDAFQTAFPNRFIETGVAEQNMVTVASGMAAMGKLPFCASYAMFCPGRCWEQIRTTICYNNRKVIIVGAHSGISVGPDGGTHQALEDIALMRILPNMTVVVPCDSLEAARATIALTEASQTSPAYLRLTREKTPTMTDENTPFTIGQSYCLYNSLVESEIQGVQKKHIAIVGCGPVLANAVNAAQILSQQGYIVEVWNMHTVKPLDTASLDDIMTRAEKLYTIEEHQCAGGLGSSIAEYIIQTAKPVPMTIIGIQDQYGQSGTMDELMKHYGLDTDSIVHRVLLR